MNTNFIPVDSTVVKEYFYDSLRNKLQIRLVSGGLYEYAVTPKVFAAFVASESKGKFYVREIKNLPYIKLDGENLLQSQENPVEATNASAPPKSNLDLANIYKYHAPKPGQPEKYTTIRELAKCLAEVIEELCPNSRERSTAFTNLEQAVMWANASIARNE